MAAIIEECSEAGWVRVITSYDAEFVATLKGEIPWSYRRWVREDRAWWVAEEFVETVARICGEFFGTVEDRRKKEQRESGNVPPHYRTLHLQPSAPRSVVKAAYRALTLDNHPDRGGDHDSMVEINRAFEKIQKERGW